MSRYPFAPALRIVFAACLATSPLLLSGCSTHREVVTTEEVGEPTVHTEVRETTVVEHEHRSVLGAVFDAAGAIIALPFRAVAALVEAIA